MKIAQIQKQSLIEYPGKISAVIFLAGCNLRCQFCFTENNHLLTDRGRLSIKDIVEKRIDCKIYSSEGDFYPINKYFQRTTKEVIQIKTFQNYEIIESTPNHKFLVYDSKIKKFLEKEAQKLNPDYDFLTISIPKKEIKNYKLDVTKAISELYQSLEKRPRFNDPILFAKVIDLRNKGYSWRKIYKILNITDHVRRIIQNKPILKPVPIIKEKNGKVAIKGGSFYLNKFIKVTPEFMRLVGYYLAEGCVSKDKERKNSYYVSFTFNLKEKNFIKDVKALFYQIFKTKLHSIKTPHNSIQLTCNKGIIGVFFKYYFGSNSLDKKIPPEFIFLRRDLQKELIKGLFWGDGVTSEKFIKKYQCQRLSCCAETLKYQISLILCRLGIKNSRKKREIEIKDKKIFDILNQSHLIKKKSIKVNRYSFIDDSYFYLKIREIKKIRKPQKVYNLEIDNKTHTYNISLVNVSNCYVPDLVLPERIEKIKGIPESEVLSFLKERKDFLEGVAISGGEPTVNPELPDFIKKIKKIGYFIELETNGTNPEMLKYLIDENLIDYVATDIKQDFIFEKWYEITGGVLTREMFENIKKSIKILLEGKIDYEFRTTLMKEFHKKEDIIEICKKIKNAKIYYLQNFEKTEGGTVSGKDFTPFSKEEIEEVVKEGKKYTNIKARPYLFK